MSPGADEREQALKAREARLDRREYLSSKGHQAELLDILGTSDVEKFKASADRLRELFGAAGCKQEGTAPDCPAAQQQKRHCRADRGGFQIAWNLI